MEATVDGPRDKPRHKSHYYRRGKRPPPLLRGRSGKGQKTPDNPGVAWHKVQDNWPVLRELGYNPDLGTEIGRLYQFGILTERQASAARLYADVVGRYDRYHPTLETDLRRNAVSPAYQRSARANDDELERREVDGTLEEYLRRGRRAQRAYKKLDKCIPNEVARAVLDELCLHNRVVPSVHHRDLKKLLDNIADAFRFKWE